MNQSLLVVIVIIKLTQNSVSIGIKKFMMLKILKFAMTFAVLGKKRILQRTSSYVEQF